MLLIYNHMHICGKVAIEIDPHTSVMSNLVEATQFESQDIYLAN